MLKKEAPGHRIARSHAKVCLRNRMETRRMICASELTLTVPLSAHCSPSCRHPHPPPPRPWPLSTMRMKFPYLARRHGLVLPCPGSSSEVKQHALSFEPLICTHTHTHAFFKINCMIVFDNNHSPPSVR